MVLEGNEKEVIEAYRRIYNQGIEPKIFINDFLELIYYLKNIELLTLESTNFSLNDSEFENIKQISKNIDNQILILFWQFTLRTLEELDLVSNQNLAIEMFLIRLVYLNPFEKKEKLPKKNDFSNLINNQNENNNLTSNVKNETINQIKNITQEEKDKPKIKSKVIDEDKITINSFNDLLNVCNEKKEIKLKYELEKNVNLVNFEKSRLEISFNDNLDKNFVKDLSIKLFDWTKERWIITFSKTKGKMSIREEQQNKKIEIIKKAKTLHSYKRVIDKFPDANLVEVKSKNNSEDS